MPTLRQLDYLVAIADTLHFRRAADRVNTTQSTLSIQLKTLEERLGTALVERSKTRVVLTPTGTEVVAIARRMLADAQAIRALADTPGRGLTGILRLGVAPSIGPSLLPRVIPRLRSEFAGLKLYVREEPPQRLPEALAAGYVDVIITPLKGAPDDAPAGDLITMPLFREPILLTLAPDHPLAKLETITFADLRGVDVLALESGHPLHQLVTSLCEESGARLMRDYEATSLDTLRQMVATGLGVTFLPALYVRTRICGDASLVVRELSGPPLLRTVGMVWRRSSIRAKTYPALARVVADTVCDAWPDCAL